MGERFDTSRCNSWVLLMTFGTSQGAKLSEAIANIGTVIVAVCFVVLTGIFVRDRLRGVRAANSSDAEASIAPSPVDDWQRVETGGVLLGSMTAPIKIVIFSDYQCPFCAADDSSLWAIRQKYGSNVALIYRDFPLVAIHPYAEAAAIAARCAWAQGRYEQYHKALFAGQNDIGSKTWEEFATEAGVPSLPDFMRCTKGKGPNNRIQEDLTLAKELRLRGTPTVIVNGLLLPPGAPMEAVEAQVKEQLRGKGR